MNWLAHLYLSEPTAPFRIGNLLPDIVGPNVLAGLPAEFQRGIVQHRRIDAFADAHPVFRRSVQRFEPPLRRFGGIIVDLAYDHFLTRDWAVHSATPLPDFTREVYAGLGEVAGHLPPEISTRLQYMRTEDWLGSYRDLDGLAIALGRVARRLKRPVDLAAAVPLIERDYAGFQADFREFFPQLKAHVK